MSTNGNGRCPHCGGSSVIREWTDKVCVTCGWRDSYCYGRPPTDRKVSRDAFLDRMQQRAYERELSSHGWIFRNGNGHKDAALVGGRKL